MPERSRAVEAFLLRLKSLGERLRTDAEALERAAVDESGMPPCRPAAVVFPLTTQDVVLVAGEAAALGVPLVPRGGGTGKVGACIPSAGDVVVDLSRMNRILQMHPDDLYVVVQPGVITGDLHAAAADQGYLYPPDPGSWESCTVGGNIATNAGGMRALKYGVTQRYVWGLQVVLPGGDVLTVGRRSIKGVTGLDITSLMVGSEGTLAMISQATLHIIPAPAAVETGWLSFPNAHSASRAAEAIFAAGYLPRIMEMMDREALDAIRGVSDFAIPEGAGAAMLLETDGPEGEAFDDLVRAAEVASQAGATDSALARKEKDRQAMRRARRLVSSSLKERFPYKISDDVAVPRSRMPELLKRAEQACEGLRLCTYGHLGDGNLHLNILCATADERQASRAARRRILELAVALEGTISGEHGIGMAKREALSIEQTQSLIDLQRRVKSAFDPAGIMNPGKVLPPP